MNRIYVKLRDPNAVIYDPPTGRRLPPEGMWVEGSLFWHRRRQALEIDITEGPAAASSPAAASGPSSSSAPTGREPVTPITTR